MVKNPVIPKRGDIVWIDFSPTKGHEQSGLRPAVVISSDEYNSFSGLALVCPMTSKRKGYFFEVAIKGPKEKSFVLADQVRSFDIQERIKKITGRVSLLEINEILGRVSVLFE
ncbi:MAG: type II toxin-antitoxin system PemK/MazF family toxin [Candidatus Pacebacteria bacterium]|nr:type II toxin-antitoxin system PemK/MazF family toxin [Candidatus Paceibacterota bacterium]